MSLAFALFKLSFASKGGMLRLRARVRVMVMTMVMASNVRVVV